MTQIINFLFPKICVNCNEEGALLCEPCAGLISPQTHFKCPFCDTPSIGGRPCETHNDSAITRVLAAGSYRDPILRKTLHAFKYSGTTALGARLGNILAQSALRFRTLLPETGVVIPMPLAPLKNRLRPFNQSLTLAHAVGTALNFEVRPALTRHFSFWDILVPSHAALTHTHPARWFSLEKIFHADDSNIVRGRDVIIVDDVLTSGANLEMAARELKTQGATTITGLVLARA